jgi:hypothetical protein
VVLTTGGTQSNHCAPTAITAAMHGLRAELYLSGPQPEARPGTCSSTNSPARPSPSLSVNAMWPVSLSAKMIAFRETAAASP